MNKTSIVMIVFISFVFIVSIAFIIYALLAAAQKPSTKQVGRQLANKKYVYADGSDSGGSSSQVLTQSELGRFYHTNTMTYVGNALPLPCPMYDPVVSMPPTPPPSDGEEDTQQQDPPADMIVNDPALQNTLELTCTSFKSSHDGSSYKNYTQLIFPTPLSSSSSDTSNYFLVWQLWTGDQNVVSFGAPSIKTSSGMTNVYLLGQNRNTSESPSHGSTTSNAIAMQCYRMRKQQQQQQNPSPQEDDEELHTKELVYNVTYGTAALPRKLKSFDLLVVEIPQKGAGFLHCSSSSSNITSSKPLPYPLTSMGSPVPQSAGAAASFSVSESDNSLIFPKTGSDGDVSSWIIWIEWRLSGGSSSSAPSRFKAPRVVATDLEELKILDNFSSNIISAPQVGVSTRTNTMSMLMCYQTKMMVTRDPETGQIISKTGLQGSLRLEDAFIPSSSRNNSSSFLSCNVIIVQVSNTLNPFLNKDVDTQQPQQQQL